MKKSGSRQLLKEIALRVEYIELSLFHRDILLP